MGQKLKEREMVFMNWKEREMTLEEVIEEMKQFMMKDPMGKYKLMIGTDSQVKRDGTLFITGVVLHRVGDGAWACRKKVMIPRRIWNIHQKISYETSLSEEMVFQFSSKLMEFEDIILPYIYKGAQLEKEVHLDIGEGKRNLTREYVREMVSRIESLGFRAVVKPDAVVASGYANRFTKMEW